MESFHDESPQQKTSVDKQTIAAENQQETRNSKQRAPVDKQQQIRISQQENLPATNSVEESVLVFEKQHSPAEGHQNDNRNQQGIAQENSLPHRIAVRRGSPADNQAPTGVSGNQQEHVDKRSATSNVTAEAKPENDTAAKLLPSVTKLFAQFSHTQSNGPEDSDQPFTRVRIGYGFRLADVLVIGLCVTLIIIICQLFTPSRDAVEPFY